MEESKSETQVRHVSFSEMPVEKVNPLLERQFVYGQRAMLARLVLHKGCVVPEHQHENEQITYILEGALRFTIEGRELTVRAGEVLVIPSNVVHRAEALEDTVDIDLFDPPRQDWITGADSYLRK